MISDSMPSHQNYGTVSRLPIILEIANKGFAQCEMIRHLSPLSIASIIKHLPLQDRIHKIAQDIVYINTGLTIGAEKPRTHFKRGDIAYMTSSASICIFVKDSIVNQMNPIGIVNSNLELLESTSAGDIMILKRSG
jgi:uncharacterized protein